MTTDKTGAPTTITKETDRFNIAVDDLGPSAAKKSRASFKWEA